jgi:hypothetical protein
MRPRSFRVRPADDDELLAVQPFGFAPEPAVSWRVGGGDSLRDHAFKTELADVPKDQFAVTRLMAVELKAGLVCDQRLKKRLPLDKLKVRDVLTVEMQEIESVIDEPHPALAVGRSLGMGEARQSGVVDAAEFAVEISGLHLQFRERGDDAWIFVGPVEPGASQELRSAVVHPRGHTKAVQFYFVQPLRPRRRSLDRLGKLRRNEARKGKASARWAGLDGRRSRTLDDTRHAGTQLVWGVSPLNASMPQYAPAARSLSQSPQRPSPRSRRRCQ